MKYLGEEGYLRITEKSMQVTARFQQGITAIEGLEIFGQPVMSKFGYGSSSLDITAVADELERAGWFVGRQQWPPGINMHVLPVHEPIVETYLQDLSRATELVRRGAIQSEGKAASYV
jgi:glutamate/tyrosine decarboxylase-like PLP-dependent enzyme